MDETGSRQYPEKPARVYLFGTCLIDLFCPQAGMDTYACSSARESRCISRLTRPAAGNQRTAAAFPSRRARWRSPSCASSRAVAGDRPLRILRRHDAPPLSQDFRRRSETAAEARALAERIFELSEFLLHVAKDPADRPGGAGAGRAAHLVCCTSRDGHACARPRAAGPVAGGRSRHARTRIRMLRLRRHFFAQASVDLVGDGRRQGRCDQGNRRADLSLGRLRLHAQPQPHPREARRSGCRGQHLATFLWQRTGGEGERQ
jgi:L-lactate dehydrogenase complex protein LldE